MSNGLAHLKGGEIIMNKSISHLRHSKAKHQVLPEDPIGEIDHDELKELTGSGDVKPQTTWACATVTLVTAVFCPTTACSSDCGTR